MVQSSSVLREPSMDEILTSIREIIEENAVQPDHFLNDSSVTSVPADRSEGTAEEGYDATLSVDDAMKALADRIGLSSEKQDFSLMQGKEGKGVENGTVGVDIKNVKPSSEEQSSVHKAKEYSGEVHVSQAENIVSSRVELSEYCVSSAEKIAKDVLRPAIAEWLKNKLPILLENILREEIVKAIKKSS
ncbi:cell pole-organizing protein PopZ [Bartonella silvatica]|uniref:Cell pole-organizing protein PopZ n=1 Tax=Bartonella silvatica TaxID=357760 RepID=A0ABV2HIJ7_9HYPH